MFHVYAIKNNLNQIYIGQTADLDKRLARHNGLLANKTTSYTKKHPGTWVVFYSEIFSSRQEAMHREKQLKSYQGREFLKQFK